jgi:hypothetical protein
MQDLKQLSHQLMDAIRARDRRALEAVLTADFVQIDELGHRLGKEPFIAAVEAGEFRSKRSGSNRCRWNNSMGRRSSAASSGRRCGCRPASRWKGARRSPTCSCVRQTAGG